MNSLFYRWDVFQEVVLEGEEGGGVVEEVAPRECADLAGAQALQEIIGW